MPPQSALAPASRGAELTTDLSWILFIGAAAIFLFVMALVIAGVLSRPRPVNARRWIIGGGLIFPVVVLTIVLAAGVFVDSAMSREDRASPVRAHVIGKLWWWEVRYGLPDGSGTTVLANELHLPVDRPTELTLSTDNVIHSFWVPSLAGKLDMIPGHRNRLRLQPTRAGVYRGQCAEYCGAQHAQMALIVVVESGEAFDRWLAHQATPAAEPATRELQAGREQFFRGGCATCHTIRGTAARGALGPDLTHVGSRRTLAAGMLDNHAGTLAGWISGAQAIKPGSLMPSMRVYTGPELRAVTAYLGSLE